MLKSVKVYRFLLAVFLLAWVNTNAQTLSRVALEKEKKENLEKIKITQKILDQTRKQRTNSVSELRVLNKQIASQEKQLYLMEQDLELIEGELQELNNATAELERKLEVLRKEYAEMIYQASKISGRINQLSFILSSQSFNELVMRYKYIQQYGDNRQQQLNQIKKVAALLTERQQQLASKKSNQVSIKQQKLTEAQELEKLKGEKSRVVNNLSKKEKELRTEIAATQRSVKKLDQRISSIIQREIARQNKIKEEARREEVKRAAAASAEVSVATGAIATPTKSAASIAVESAALVGTNFAANQRRIPWPVKNGIISDKFGVKNHPVLKGVQIDNNGVNIQTSPNATVQAVFNGTVMDVTDIPGLNRVIAIQHGEYFTVYANLSQVFVASGQQVSANETIGTAATIDGITEINFQIWNNVKRLNPELWLRR